MRKLAFLIAALMISLTSSTAQEPSAFNSNFNFAQVQFVRASQDSDGLWTFSVTIRHRDEGWKHYANLWVVTDPETGETLGQRVLAHPHDLEQPFTRSVSKILLPPDQRYLEVKAKCTLHGWEGQRVVIDLATDSGSFYVVERNF